jgi:formate C-acetyltransferase
VLDANFDGYENIRIMLDNGTPFFGNDTDETDEIANQVFGTLTKTIFELNDTNPKNDKYVSTFFSYFNHVLSGEISKATPNGRFAGEPLSDSMAPTQGKDTGGPTKMLNSVLKIDHSYVTGGYALNLKVNPDVAKTVQGTAALKNLLTAYLLSGGPQLQINYVEIETLRDAQKYPERHKDLIVRVGGYCERFVNLDRVLQNEIINRTTN